MLKTRVRYYRILFRFAAIWSWGLSLVAVVAEPVLVSSLQLPPPQPRLFLHLTILPVALFGFGFWWVARDLTKNHAVPAIAGPGGVLTFGFFVIAARTEDLPLVLLAPAFVDLVLGLLFLEFLWSARYHPDRIVNERADR